MSRGNLPKTKRCNRGSHTADTSWNYVQIQWSSIDVTTMTWNYVQIQWSAIVVTTMASPALNSGLTQSTIVWTSPKLSAVAFAATLVSISGLNKIHVLGRIAWKLLNFIWEHNPIHITHSKLRFVAWEIFLITKTFVPLTYLALQTRPSGCVCVFWRVGVLVCWCVCVCVCVCVCMYISHQLSSKPFSNFWCFANRQANRVIFAKWHHRSRKKGLTKLKIGRPKIYLCVCMLSSQVNLLCLLRSAPI